MGQNMVLKYVWTFAAKKGEIAPSSADPSQLQDETCPSHSSLSPPPACPPGIHHAWPHPHARPQAADTAGQHHPPPSCLRLRPQQEKKKRLEVAPAPGLLQPPPSCANPHASRPDMSWHHAHQNGPICTHTCWCLQSSRMAYPRQRVL